MNAAPVYDLILQGGHVICPASGIDDILDVAVAGGTVALLAKDIPPSTVGRSPMSTASWFYRG